MSLEWVIIEALAILIETTAHIFFLANWFKPKFSSHWVSVGAWIILVAWGLLAKFNGLHSSFYDIGSFGLLFLYTFLARDGSFLSKAFGLFIAYAVTITTSMVGAGITATLTQTSYQYSASTQDTPRLIAIVLIKMLQVIVFYVLSKKSFGFHRLKKGPIWVLISAVAIIVVCTYIIWLFATTTTLDEPAIKTVAIVSTGLLIAVVLLFVMYELFAREEVKNISLQTELQRSELQSQFYHETDAMYSDMRKWRHDYRNNIAALRALIESADKEKALIYIDKIVDTPGEFENYLHTGNLVLDAVVSSKLRLAQLRGVEIDIQAVYPEHCPVDDDDLCSVAGNLLDNALEACERMGNENIKRFIEFSLLIVGKNLTLCVSNSYNGELQYSKGRYESMKAGYYHGLGLHIVDSVADKYQGFVMREHKGGVFKTTVVIPLIKQGEKV